ncbi:phosphonoacetaldehyde reductase [Candidatus Woesearchaeota archaeon]|jgi:alcohol dehydrogenase|nr:phosphonoacetaldehyde reductase [Candidatus Woesearchaeota archaeon]MBT4387367.1 phosphonoacetaldehyde reductase [Candidatus Woesearchaeota archaeon]MBT4595506.1 phosphonoacetaldehyde reductase [Candidatus Woesearchaeota archaeon]MBT5741121.1 phosphonoacetaldehyde reductase [Candidatus Woesearchaeota archaeon]MBT6506019.1 phosphonoacetaldehyde reductase [Candidatus Woesearchaeota archaeon]
MQINEFIGIDCLNQITEIIKSENIQNIFLVTGKKSFENSGAKEKLDELIKNLNITHYFDFEVNPKFEDVLKGIDLFKQNNCELIISCGGGSAMDIAKSISILSSQKETNLRETVIKNSIIEDNKYTHIAIPTTAGSGSEVTHFGVIYVNNKKYSLTHKSMKPNFYFLDPSLLMSNSEYQKATSGIDAFSQAIESFWSVNSNTESIEYSIKAIELLWHNLEDAVKTPTIENLQKIFLGSNYAGKAINIAKTTASHSISYPITTFFKISHGHAVYLTIPEMFYFNSNITEKDCNDKRGVNYVKEKMKKLQQMFGGNSFLEAKQNLELFGKNLNLENLLSNLGINRENINLIIQNGFNPQRVKNNPRYLNEENLKTILEKIY